MEENRGSWWLDLVLVGAAAAVPAALIGSGVESTALRLLTGLPLVLFLPGYATIAALYPERREECEPPFTRETGEGIDKPVRSRVRGMTGIDLLGVSVAASVAIFPGVALVHHLASGVIQPVPFVASLTLLTVAFVFIGLARRVRLPPEHRFAVSFATLFALYTRFFTPGSHHMGNQKPYEATNAREVVLNLVLAGALLVALTSVAFAVVQPPSSQSFDELAVLTQNDDGEYVAENYPDDLSGSETLYVSVTNDRDSSQEYVVHAYLEVVSEDGEVVERDEQKQETIELRPGEQTFIEHDPEASLSGERLRLRYTLVLPDSDGEPHRSVHVWVTGAPEERVTVSPTPEPTETPTETEGEMDDGSISLEMTPDEEGGTPTPDEGGTSTEEATSTPEGEGTPTPTDEFSIDV